MNPLFFIFVLVLVSLDQSAKFLAEKYLVPGQSISVTPFFDLTYLRNTGMAFSMFDNKAWSNVMFASFAVLLLAVLFVWLILNKSKFSGISRLSIILVVSGALGNLIDRIFRGYVVDFLDFFYSHHHWPAFNVADSCITVGGILLGLYLFRD